MVAGATVVAASVQESGPVFPDHWDRRIEGIARWVENDRRLSYKHPVQVNFLSPSQYSKVSRGVSDPPPTKQDRIDASNTVAQYRALGLLEGDVDLLVASKELFDSGTLAFYDNERKVVNVRGTKMTVDLRVTLAHELTHVLQDQWFDLSRIGDRDVDGDETMAFRSLVEGDAVTTENRYVDQLSDADRAAYEAASSASSDKSKADLSDVPDVLSTSFAAQYAIGPGFVSVVEAKERSDEADPAAMDAVLRSPPDSTAFLFHPPDFFADVRRAKVDRPKQPKGDGAVVDKGVMGAYDLFILLSERIDPVEAMHAVDGWRGDAYLAAVEGPGKVVCEEAKFVTAGNTDGAELRAALTEWAASLPAASHARISGSGTRAGFRTCDPGKDAKVGVTGRSADALAYPASRLQYMAQVITVGVPPDEAFCEADIVIGGLGLADLQAAELSDALKQKVIGLRDRASDTCGS